MNKEERKILNEFYFGQITKEEFLERYPVNLSKNEDYIYSTIKDTFDKQDGDDLELALLLLIFNKDVTYPDKFVELLCLLLKAHWHQQHEHIALMFGTIKSPKSVDTLYETALTKFDYLDYDDSLPLAIKCIYALGEINTEHSKEKLELLADSDDPIIKKEAEKQLYHGERN